ncbi:MAG: 6-phosphofructokinase [Phycisphaerales bacterium]|nr:6-phosphofructokinase [Phycisphaerales bacterium]MCB9857346.1 6-phosphofructokinase [Phycisphaerales bacterium]
MNRPTLAIIVGGGPAPGINAVIGAATIEAINGGMAVIGIYEGFRHLVSDNFVPERHSTTLDIPKVARIHFEGGSILKTARTTLLNENKLSETTVVEPDARKVDQVVKHFAALGVTHLLTIGGDDTALSARFVAAKTNGRIRVVHVPKTIDNDLPLPGDVPTFGFNTARHLGSELVRNLMEDARTTQRWYVVVVMGRHAGFLALGMGKSTGATLTLIPETFPENISFGSLADVIEGAMIKRKSMGRSYGVVIVAEGLAYRLGDKDELEQLLGRKVPLDAAGHLRLAEVPLGRLIGDELTRRFNERGEKATIVPQTLGYVLRCAPPVPFDMSYCRDLGNGAVRLLRDPKVDLRGGVMVTIQGSNICPMNFSEMIDPKTNRTRIRCVDVQSDAYRVARAYMICLEESDFTDPVMLARLAASANMTEDDFQRRFRGALGPMAYQPADSSVCRGAESDGADVVGTVE